MLTTTPTAATPRVVAVWRQGATLTEFHGPELAPLVIPPGPDADGGRRRLAEEARAIGLQVEWPGESTSRERRAERRAERRQCAAVPMVQLKASAFRDGAVVIHAGSGSEAA